MTSSILIGLCKIIMFSLNFVGLLLMIFPLSLLCWIENKSVIDILEQIGINVTDLNDEE